MNQNDINEEQYRSTANIRAGIDKERAQEVTRGRWKGFIYLVVICVGLFFYASVDAQEKRWLTPITWYSVDCPERVFREMRRVMREVEGYSVPITYGGDSAEFRQNGKSEVTCSGKSPFKLELNSELGYQDSHLALATTRRWYKISTGELVEFDIWLREPIILLKTNTRHEAIHGLGLDHVEDEESIMYRSATAEEIELGTIRKLMNRYNRCDYSVTDHELNRYTPKLRAFDELYYTVEANVNGDWRVEEYGPTECE